MSSVAISAPSPPAATAIQSVTLAFGSCAESAEPAEPAVAAESATKVLRLCSGLLDRRFVLRSRMLGIDVRRHRQPRQQQIACLRISVEMDAHRHALHDLREV